VSTVAVILIVIAGILLLLFLGGLVSARRRIGSPRTDDSIAAADRALEQARASDRGWDRDAMANVVVQALTSERPDFEWSKIELVLVDDRPGVAEDHAVMSATGASGSARVVLARRADGDWFAELVD
jgi:type II secretory pathway pseudopilin PulG